MEHDQASAGGVGARPPDDAARQLRWFVAALHCAVAVEATLLVLPLWTSDTSTAAGLGLNFGVHGLNHAVSPSGFNLRHPEFPVGPPPQWALAALGAAVTVGAFAAALFPLIHVSRAWASSPPKRARATSLRGPRYRLPNWLGVGVLLGWTWLWTADAGLYNNHYYLYSVLMALVALCALCGDDAAEDGPTVSGDACTAATTITALRVQVGIVYFWAAIAKLDPDWLDGTIPAAILDHPDRRWVASLLGADVAPLAMAWGGVGVLLLAPPALVAQSRRIRGAGQLAVGAFHTANLALFGVSGIGCFSLVMLAGLRLLYPVGVAGRIRSHTAAAPQFGTTAALALLVCQAVLPIAQFSGGTAQPPGWGKRHDRWAWRMKATVDRLGVELPARLHASGDRHGHAVVPLCAVARNGVHVTLGELNPAQREEVCLRPAAAIQYGDLLLGSSRRAVGPPPSSLCFNTWLSLNRHPFQPRYNVSTHATGTATGGCWPALEILGWDRSFGKSSAKWGPVWAAVQRKFAVGGFRVEFFVLPGRVTGRFPWFQNQALPAFCEVLHGSLTVRLRLREGARAETFQATAARDGAVAEFPAAVHEWWVDPSSDTRPTFFVLAWRAEESTDTLTPSYA
jgi:hypothetical protein